MASSVFNSFKTTDCLLLVYVLTIGSTGDTDGIGNTGDIGCTCDVSDTCDIGDTCDTTDLGNVAKTFD